MRVEDCLQNGQKLSALCRLEQEESKATEEATPQPLPEETEETTGDSSNSEPTLTAIPKVETTPTIEEEPIPQLEEHVPDTTPESIPKVEEETIPQQEPESEEDDCVIVSEEKPVPIPTVEQPACDRSGRQAGENSVAASREDDEGPLSSPYGRMEIGDGPGTALLRFPDDRSDSGVSSLRSGSCASGDERSGSRSSALSSSDEPQHHQQQQDRHDNRILR